MLLVPLCSVFVGAVSVLLSPLVVVGVASADPEVGVQVHVGVLVPLTVVCSSSVGKSWAYV